MTDKINKISDPEKSLLFYDDISSTNSETIKILPNDKNLILTNTDAILTQKSFDCACGKKYKHRQSLFTHKKTCSYSSDNLDKNENILDISDTNSLIIQLLKQNQDLQKTLIEISKEKIVVNNNNTNTNNHQTFNLNFFLNEQCKDALNINEFVDSIKVQISDLETTGRQGYVQGVTSIINKNLNKLDKYKRPIHCSDLKRETLYIKDNNEWIKEGADKPVLRNAIKQVANKNIQQINEWKHLNPGCSSSDSKKNDMYLKIVSNAMSGATSEEQIKNYDKIIGNIMKVITIEK